MICSDISLLHRAEARIGGFSFFWLRVIDCADGLVELPEGAVSGIRQLGPILVSLDLRMLGDVAQDLHNEVSAVEAFMGAEVVFDVFHEIERVHCIDPASFL